MSDEAKPAVLIVDDHPEARSSLAELFRASGFEPHEAADGLEALALLRDRPPPALIVLDLLMPNMDGWTFLDYLRADPRLAAVPVAVCSAAGGPNGLGSVEGARWYFCKPADPAAILDAARRVRA